MNKYILLVIYLLVTACKPDKSKPTFANEVKSAAVLDEAKTKGKYIINNYLLTTLASIFNEKKETDWKSFNEELSSKLKQLEVLNNNTQFFFNKQASYFKDLSFKNASIDIKAIDERLVNTLSKASSMFSHNVADMYIIENYVRQTSISINIIEAEYLNLTIRFLETLQTDCNAGMSAIPDDYEMPHFHVEDTKSQLGVNDNDKELNKNKGSTLSVDNSDNAKDYKSQFIKQNPTNNTVAIIVSESRQTVSASAYAFDHRFEDKDVRQAFKEQCQIVQKILTPLHATLRSNISQEFIQEQTVNFEKLNTWIKNRVDLEKALLKKESDLHKKHADIRLNSLNEEDKNKLISYIKEKNLSDEKQEELKNIWLEEKNKENSKSATNLNQSQFIKDFTKTDFDGNRLDAFKELTILPDINKQSYLKELMASVEFKKLVNLDKSMNPTELSGYIYTLVAINHLKAASVAANGRKNLDKFENYFSKENKAILRKKSGFITYLASKTDRRLYMSKDVSAFYQDIGSSQIIGELYLELDQIVFKMAQTAIFTFSANANNSNSSMTRELNEQQDRWFEKLIQAQVQFPNNKLLSILKQHFQEILETKNEH